MQPPETTTESWSTMLMRSSDSVIPVAAPLHVAPESSVISTVPNAPAA